ncbi:MAG TPA: hypothetical protein VHG72_02755 [Polyangia bacterium]|nr:hypothetical protein [Polyangia bacterium]
MDPGESHDTYNSTIDAFIDAFSIASIKATGNMNAPGRNDGMDFMHFFYMNPSTVLLSDDVKQRSYAQGAGQSTVSFEEYRRLTLR